MKYIICGFSGAGKTTKLAQVEQSGEYSGYRFIDLDNYIFESHKIFHKNLGELIEQKGWDWFRKTEKTVLSELLRKDNLWISLGGGTLTDEICDLLERQENQKVMWLDTPFEVCWDRIKDDKTRPLVQQGREKMQELYRNRCLAYKNYPKLED